MRISQFRRRFPPTPEGEADAWLALYQELSRHGWDRVILETSGLNGRLCFLYRALPPGRILTLKLVCSLDTTCLSPEEVFTSVVEKLKAIPGIS